MPVWGEPMLSPSPATKPAPMPTVAPIRLVDTASLIDSPPSIATGAPPTTNFALAPAVSTGPPIAVRSVAANPVAAALATPVSSCVPATVPFVTHNPSLPLES